MIEFGEWVDTLTQPHLQTEALVPNCVQGYASSIFNSEKQLVFVMSPQRRGTNKAGR